MDEIGADPGASFPANGLSGLFDSLDRLLTQIGHRVGMVASLRAQGLLSAKGLVFGLTGLLLLLLLPFGMERLLRRLNHVEPNFRGERIPQSFGLTLLLWTGAMLSLNGFLFADYRRASLLWLLTVVGFGLLGFVDDTWGTKHIKGLRGHFRAALREHTLTTGFVKAVGGALLALFLGWKLEPDHLPLAFLDAALIALSANFINLLDLRPGRASGVFLLLTLPLTMVGILSGGEGALLLLFVLIPALIVWQKDSRALVMMGDTGSNLLGATLGLALCTPFIGLSTRLLALLLLLLIHIVAERVSLTQLIARNPTLNRIDRWTGVR